MISFLIRAMRKYLCAFVILWFIQQMQMNLAGGNKNRQLPTGALQVDSKQAGYMYMLLIHLEFWNKFVSY